MCFWKIHQCCYWCRREILNIYASTEFRMDFQRRLGPPWLKLTNEESLTQKDHIAHVVLPADGLSLLKKCSPQHPCPPLAGSGPPVRLCLSHTESLLLSPGFAVWACPNGKLLPFFTVSWWAKAVGVLPCVWARWAFAELLPCQSV